MRPSLLLVLALVAGCSPSGGSHGGAASTAASVAGATSGQTLRAGASAVDITPPPGGPLAGFGGPPRRKLNAVTIPLHLLALGGNCFDPNPNDAVTLFEPATGTLDPVMARAVVIDNGVKKVAILKLDTIATVRTLHDDLAAYASASLGVAPENLIVCATHTHSGPGAMSKQLLWQIIGSDCYNDAQYRRLLAGCQQALTDADLTLRPAKIGWGKTFETAASHNRRNRPGIYDPEIGILKIVEAQSDIPIAAVLNFAVHGTKHGGDNMLYSADVMGEAERFIEGRLGAGVAVFINGAEGDVAPDGNCGPLVGQRFVDAWPQVPVRSWVELAGAFDDVPMPKPTVNTGCFPIPGTSNTICNLLPGFSLSIPLDARWLSQTGPFKAVRIGGLVLATLPGEPITEIGWDVKARAAAKGFEQAFVVGLANDHLSYVTTRAEYYRGEYEGQGTLYGPTTGEIFVQSADAVMDRVKP